MAPHVHTRSDKRIFVFGSNVEGRHAGGAAWYAYNELDAEWGKGEGFGWQNRSYPEDDCSYALPTMSIIGKPLPLSELKEAVDRFIEIARSTPQWQYFVSEVGCGIAGFKAEDVAPLFAEAPGNCDLPPGWRKV